MIKYIISGKKYHQNIISYARSTGSYLPNVCILDLYYKHVLLGNLYHQYNTLEKQNHICHLCHLIRSNNLFEANKKTGMKILIPMSQCSPPNPFLHEHRAILSKIPHDPPWRQKFCWHFSLIDKTSLWFNLQNLSIIYFLYQKLLISDVFTDLKC